MVTRELVGKVVCFSYVTHQKVIVYSWILAITRANWPLKSTSSTIAFNRQKWSWNLSIRLRVTQIAAGSSCGRRSSQVGRMSFGTMVNRSQVTLEFFSRSNFCRARPVTRGGRAQVVGRSLIGRKALQASRRSVASVSRRSDRGFDSGARVYADRLTSGMRGSRARKSVVVRSQVTLITWPVIHFLFPRMLVAPQHRCKS